MTEAELADRLERLERDNRRLKKLATVALVIAAALGAIYAARPVPQKIEAHEFDVVDNSGMVRVKVTALPGIALYDTKGRTRAVMGLFPDSEPDISLIGADGKQRAEMGVNTTGAGFTLNGDDGKIRAEIEVIPSGAPTISINDPQGYHMDLGSSATVNKITGAAQKTSAASITMFGNGKGHPVIWQAP